MDMVGGAVGLPRNTRLRFVRAREPEQLQAFCAKQKSRIQIYSIAFDGKAWVMWFVPDDSKEDIKSLDLTKAL